VPAVRVEQFGIDNLPVRDLPEPAPGVGEVLIATEAATINPSDAAVVTGAAGGVGGFAVELAASRGSSPFARR
jgi:NADPH:quinone reductase-like Zn-dependent oxidoreductase